MSNEKISAAQMRDPNYTPPMHLAIPLGIQHVLAMFIANVTPAIIVAGAAGFGIRVQRLWHQTKRRMTILV